MNQEVLPLHVKMNVDNPFYIEDGERKLSSCYEVNIESMSSITVTVRFVPPDTEDMYCCIYEGNILLTVKDYPMKVSSSYILLLSQLYNL